VRCPNDGATLLLSERQGVEIDYCPDCRGVWLDRGELDKLIERADRDSRDSTDRRDEDDDDRRGRKPPAPKKKKSSFLKDMFENFGQE
jgi:uncharacterized protein